MKIKILGSGGFLSIPRAGCSCRICQKAREEDWPYQRRGPSLFINDINVLIDTPEDINESLNFNRISKIENIFYTHWHPDHTLGFRIVELLQESEFLPIRPKPINIYIPVYDWGNFRKFLPGLWYFESKGYIKLKKLLSSGVRIKNFKFEPIRLIDTTFSAYLVREKRKKAVLCPDHSRHLPIIKGLLQPDLLVLNLGYSETNLKNCPQLPAHHRLRKFTSFKNNLETIKQLEPHKTVLVHIEELWNRDKNDYLKLENQYKKYNLKFAIDGLEIKI